MECPHCGNTEIVSEYFEDEIYAWCQLCGKQVYETEEGPILTEEEII